MTEYKDVQLKIPLTPKRLFQVLLLIGFILPIVLGFFIDWVMLIFSFFSAMYFLGIYCSEYNVDRNPFHYVGYCVHFVCKKENEK